MTYDECMKVAARGFESPAEREEREAVEAGRFETVSPSALWDAEMQREDAHYTALEQGLAQTDKALVVL